jgi:hypothetical protein
MTSRALDLSLRIDPEALTARIYDLHSIALEQATDYSAALGAMSDAVALCRSRGLEDDANVCLACLTPALRHTGQWDRAIEVGNEVLAREDAPEVARMVAIGEIGLILANRGKVTPARRNLARSAAFSLVHELFPLEIETNWGLARVDELDGDHEGATARLRDLGARCLAREEFHYSVAALRWAASFFGQHGLQGELGACTDALARVAAAMGTAEATAALAHALGEGALLEGDARRAADQFERTRAAGFGRRPGRDRGDPVPRRRGVGGGREPRQGGRAAGRCLPHRSDPRRPATRRVCGRPAGDVGRERDSPPGPPGHAARRRCRIDAAGNRGPAARGGRSHQP